MNIKFLQQFLVDDVEIGDLILAQDQLKTLDAGFQGIGAETPEWVTDKLGLVSNEIVSRNRVQLQKRLRAAEARRAGLATPDEKRKQLEEEITRLKEQLA